jgi:hypothetical protein
MCSVVLLIGLRGSALNTTGPAITACLGVVGYALYVGSLWYFDQTGNEWFPIFGDVAIGVSLGKFDFALIY